MCFLWFRSQRMLAEHGGAPAPTGMCVLAPCWFGIVLSRVVYQEHFGRLFECKVLSLFQAFWVRISGKPGQRVGIFYYVPR